LLARLYFDCLASEDNLRGIRRALQDLPYGLIETYDRLMERINQQHPTKIKRVEQLFTWMSCATRPMTVKELQSAMATESSDDYSDSESFPDMNAVVSTCYGIVTVDQASQAVRFVHYTFQDYHTNRYSSSSHLKAQKYITQTCLTYLCFKIFESGYCICDDDLSERIDKYPFLSYASKNWGLHMRRHLELDPEIQALVLRLFSDKHKMESAVQAMKIGSQRYNGYSQVEPNTMHGLWLAAHFGLEEICRILLFARCNVNEITSESATALHEASKYGYSEVVKLLLQYGAAVDAIDKYNRTSLHESARGGHLRVLECLVDNKANVNAKTRSGRTALHEAASNGQVVSAEYLLTRGASTTEYTEPSRWTPLHSAVSHGSVAMTSLFLKYGADIGATSSLRETALHIAVAKDDENVVRCLLNAKAEMEVVDTRGDTAIGVATRDGFYGIYLLLLHRGADVGTVNYAGKTLLHLASISGNQLIVEHLLQRGASLMAKDNGDCTPLHDAAANGHLKVVNILLHNGSDINSVSLTGRTALHDAVGNGHFDVISLLLRSGANTEFRYRPGLMSNIDRSQQESIRKSNIQMNSLTLRSSIVDFGFTAADLASLSGYRHITELFAKHATYVHKQSTFHRSEGSVDELPQTHNSGEDIKNTMYVRLIKNGRVGIVS
jgi:ankyrin repeat protein